MTTILEETLTPQLEEVSRPISEAEPVGADISYDDDFQALKDEIDQISSVNPEGVDYGRIVETCRMLLGQKSKDLRVSTYLAMALARTEGYRGVLEGLLAQQVLVERYWEAMYPPLRRMRARQGAFQFMAERLSESVSGGSPAQGDREAIEGSLEVLQGLQGFVMEAMGEEAPVLSGLRKALDDALRRIPKPAAAPPAAAPKPPAASRPAAATAAAAQPAAAAPAVADLQSEGDALAAMLKVASFLREQNPAGPASYRLARLVRWGDLTAEPSNQQGKTLFPDLAPHRLTYLNTLTEDKDWATLLKVAEDTFREIPYHFLLDLQRFVVTAMDGLGADYEAARQAVLFETAMLVRQFPNLPGLTFMGGMPFADPKTRYWLDETVQPVLASGSGGGGAATDDQALADQYAEAKKLSAGGNLAGAMKLLQDGSKQDGSQRSRFLRRFYMAQLCMQGNQAAVACPILEGLDGEIEAFSLQAWEPALALEVWSQLHRCYDMLRAGDTGAKEGLDERARRVFSKIAQIDVNWALKAGGG